VATVDDGALVLETERLVLRHLTSSDLDALARIYRDSEVRRYFPEGTLTYHETSEELEWIIDVYYRRYGYGLWATVLKESGAFIGRCGLLPWKVVSGPDGRPGLDGADEEPDPAARVEVEVAYLLAREYWGRGLATEAARAIVAHAFGTLRLTRLICLVEPLNVASRRVAAKIGMSDGGDVWLDGERLPLLAMAAVHETSRVEGKEERIGGGLPFGDAAP
jgi:ribosomal-protein-alanine N-acetyltransferase